MGRQWTETLSSGLFCPADPTVTMAFVCATPAMLAKTAVTARRSSGKTVRVAPTMAFELAKPPYELDALEPHMSKQTLEFHWGKHHQTYVTNVNTAVGGTEDEKLSMEEIMMKSWNGGSYGGLFNNSAQV